MQTLVRDMTDDDAEAVLAIYREGIATGDATFQTDAPAWTDWSQGHLAECRLIATLGDTVAGWATLAPTSSRPVYRGVVEVSIYIGTAYQGCGVGNMLLGALVERSEAGGFWSLIAGIFPEIVASIQLHKRHGFRELGVHEKMGKMAHGPHAGAWRDVVLLERRSERVGMD